MSYAAISLIVFAAMTAGAAPGEAADDLSTLRSQIGWGRMARTVIGA